VPPRGCPLLDDDVHNWAAATDIRRQPDASNDS